MKKARIKLGFIYVIIILGVSGCENFSQSQKLKQGTISQRTLDSIQSNKELNAIADEALYVFAKDTIRREWILTHPYMCYYSSHFVNETNGYDKNGKRVTNQFLGMHEKENTICIDRRKNLIIWSWVKNSKQESADFQIKQVDEYRDETSFGVNGPDGEKYVFNVPDNGKKISFLGYDKTIVFVVDK